MATPSASFAETETVSLSPEMSAAGMVTLYVPALSVAGSVFAVVFATMLYATGKIRKENTVDALKNENL